MSIINRFASESYVLETLEVALKDVGISQEPADNDIPRVFIDGVIPTTKDEVNAELTYTSKSLSFHSYIIIKCQGTSSMKYPKKNFTIKLYSDPEHSSKLKINFKGWGANNISLI